MAKLKQICNTDIFLSDCDVDNKELEKIQKYCRFIKANKHGEYDFGSYKRGYILAKENNILEQADELIFANDSCYGPLYDLGKVFEKMETQDIDFWGMIIIFLKYLMETK